MEKRSIIIDTDAGCDDCVAISLALTSEDIEVAALTTVFGNVSVEQATHNVGVLLGNFAGDRHIPYFKGSAQPLSRSKGPSGWAGHGMDGMGGERPTSFSCSLPSFSKTAAAVALINLINEKPNVYELLMLGPLTNLALAHRLDPSIVSKVKSVTVMGGAFSGRGNSSPSAEFNFHADPEAASVVLSAFSWHKHCHLSLVPWEVCENAALSWAEFDKLSSIPNSRLSKFWKRVCSAYAGLCHPGVRGEASKAKVNQGAAASSLPSAKRQKTTSAAPEEAEAEGQGGESEDEAFMPCDAYAFAVLSDPSLVQKSSFLYCQVETQSSMAAGTVILDWYSRHGTGLASNAPEAQHLEGVAGAAAVHTSPKVKVVQRVNKQRFHELLRKAAENALEK